MKDESNEEGGRGQGKKYNDGIKHLNVRIHRVRFLCREGTVNTIKSTCTTMYCGLKTTDRSRAKISPNTMTNYVESACYTSALVIFETQHTQTHEQKQRGILAIYIVSCKSICQNPTKRRFVSQPLVQIWEQTRAAAARAPPPLFFIFIASIDMMQRTCNAAAEACLRSVMAGGRT